jgi:iron complex transport system substrate-binding protein
MLVTRFLAPLTILLTLGYGCHSSGTGSATDSGAASTSTSAAGTSAAGPAKGVAHSVIKYAHGFRIDYFDHYRDISILNRNGGRMDTLHYLLVEKGAAPPADRPGVPVIITPVNSLAVLSSAHIALADFAGVADRITGLGSLQYVNSPIVRAGIRSGKVKQIGIDQNINNELLIAMHPGLLIAMSNPDASFGEFKTLTDAGIPVLPDADWLETTPLGRAEWVKLMGALVDKEELVDRKFDSVEKAYLQLAALGTKAKTKPSVISEVPFKGTWYMPAGGSYVAQFFRDAGADYAWSDTKGTGSLPLNFEAVVPVALKADVWLNVGDANTRADLASRDTRYTGFRSFRTDSIYNCNRRVNDLGMNDYWESGIVNPQLVLADLIRILHPGLLPADTLQYYKKIK